MKISLKICAAFLVGAAVFAAPDVRAQAPRPMPPTRPVFLPVLPFQHVTNASQLRPPLRSFANQAPSGTVNHVTNASQLRPPLRAAMVSGNLSVQQAALDRELRIRQFMTTGNTTFNASATGSPYATLYGSLNFGLR
ncbi:MAG: hypothetical protein ACJ8F7_10590 [Gemmataceae bacterium]